MSDNNTDNQGTPQKKLVLKKSPETKGLKIKAKELPELQETPEPKAPGTTTKAPNGLTIKAATQAHAAVTDSTPGTTTKAPKGLTIKAAPQEPGPATDSTPKGLTIKGATQAHAAATDSTPGTTTKTPKGLTIKAAPQEPAPAPAPQPKGLTIKAAQQDPTQQQAPIPIQQVQQQMNTNPLGTPPPIPAPSYTAPVTSSKPPPPMPSGYSTPPPPKTAVNPQGPMFPSQGQAANQQPPALLNQGEPAVNPQGPVFPTAQASPASSGVRPPGTMPPPTHKRDTSAPLSAIMGEVRPAKKIDPSQLQAQQALPASNEPQVVKVKKPAGFIKDSLGNEYCLVPKGTYFIGMDNEQEEVKVAFTLGKYQVTKEQYFEFIKETGTAYSPEELNLINKISPFPNCPAIMVSWQDAKSFCRWMREKTGEYYALPSIKEWEAAARSTDGRIYPWGDEEPSSERVCFNDGYMEPQSTCSVDYFQNNVSTVGCIGMIGNVMEWTLDSFEDERNPHILKGGSWMSSIDFCNNVTPCMSYPENKRKDFFGFRLLYLPKELYQEYKKNTNR